MLNLLTKLGVSRAPCFICYSGESKDLMYTKCCGNPMHMY